MVAGPTEGIMDGTWLLHLSKDCLCHELDVILKRNQPRLLACE
jgi:hypothetical protein